MSDNQSFVSKQDIAGGLKDALKAALAKHEAALIEAAAAEAAGNRKLAKTGDDRLVPMPIDKNAMQGYGPQAAGVGNQMPGMSKDEYDGDESCPMCGGHAELLGHLGSEAHYRCRSCGAMAHFPVHGGDEHSHSESSHSESTPELEKVTPPDVSEKVVHKLKDEYGHDKAGKAKAFATAWKIHNQKAAKKSEPEDELAARRKESAGVTEARRSKKIMTDKKCPHCGDSSSIPHKGGERTCLGCYSEFTPDAKKSEIEVPPTSTVIDKPAKGAKMPGKPAAVAAPGSGGLKKDAAMPHKEAHPDTAAALSELRGIHSGAIPHPDTVASLHALRGPHPDTAASLADVRSMSPRAMAATPVKPAGAHPVTAITAPVIPRVGAPAGPEPTGMVSRSHPNVEAAQLNADKRAAGIGFLSNLITRFKGVGNKTWANMAGRGPANIARAARTAATRMALSEKDGTKTDAKEPYGGDPVVCPNCGEKGKFIGTLDNGMLHYRDKNGHGIKRRPVKKALIVDGAMKAEKPMDKATAEEANKEIKGFKSIVSNPMAVRGNVGAIAKPKGLPVAKAAMAGGIPAAPKPPAAAKPPGAKMTMPKQPTMGKTEKKSRIPGKK
jgi:transposase-like protein